MRVDKEEIQGLKVVEYVNRLSGLPSMLCNKAEEADFIRFKSDRYAIWAWKWHVYSVNTEKSSTFGYWYAKFQELYKQKQAQLKDDLESIGHLYDDLLKIALSAGVLCEVIPEKKDIEIASMLMKARIDTHSQTKIEVFDLLLDDKRSKLERMKLFNENCVQDEIKRFENIDFKCVESIKQNEIYSLFYSNDWLSAIDELAELAFYKELIAGEYEEKGNEKSPLSMVDKLKMLKDVGLFGLSYFSINPQTATISEREQSRFLSKLLGANDVNIRKRLKEIR